LLAVTVNAVAGASPSSVIATVQSLRPIAGASSGGDPACPAAITAVTAA